MLIDNGAAVVEGPSLPALYRLFIVPVSQNMSITVATGGDVDLTCEAENYIFRQWLTISMNRHEAVINSSDLHRVVTPDLQLRFRGIQLEDQGIYRCLLSNVLGEVEVIANITVVGKYRLPAPTQIPTLSTSLLSLIPSPPPFPHSVTLSLSPPPLPSPSPPLSLSL